MTRHLEKSNFDVLHTATFSILHSEDSITRQLRVAELKLDYFSDSNLRSGMQSYLDGLRYVILFADISSYISTYFNGCLFSVRIRIQEAVRGTETKKIPLSFDYCIAAQLKNDSDITTVDAATESVPE
jgi:hypothetical protein